MGRPPGQPVTAADAAGDEPRQLQAEGRANHRGLGSALARRGLGAADADDRAGSSIMRIARETIAGLATAQHALEADGQEAGDVEGARFDG